MVTTDTPIPIKQNPLSFVGSFKRIAPIAYNKHGWDKVGMVTVAVLAILFMWTCVLAWYAVLTGLLPAWLLWGALTLNRRHHIYEVHPELHARD